MRIKKHSNKNEYVLTEQNMWVRDFTKRLVPFTDINKTIEQKDHALLLKNEFNNSRNRIPWVDAEDFHHSKIVIVSNGLGFQEKHRILEKLPNDITIIGVNGTLAKWQSTRSMNYYLVNNPYQECMTFLPRHSRSLPKCIISTRTNQEFVEAYRGAKYRYAPVCTNEYSGANVKEAEYQIDDYRNPICAAIGLAHRFGVEKLLLLCCDDCFTKERPSAEKLSDGIWMYPQQRVAHGLIDANLYWLTHDKRYKVMTADHSSGPNYKNAVYINEDQLLRFFEVSDE
jgi:hypothetical protein